MPTKIPLPTEQMIKTAGHISCKIPLACVETCKIKKCTKDWDKHLNYEVDDTKHLEKIDNYWADFLKAQQNSAANYLYKIQIYGNAKDPTMVRKEPFPPELVHQRLLHMPIVGALDMGDMFYILSFILNLLKLQQPKQQEYMESLQDAGLLDTDIINYMQIIARHQNTGIKKQDLEDFLKMTQSLIQRVSTSCNTNYFNPDHIFVKSMVEIDPYEMQYLKLIMSAKDELTKQQFMYLVNFVERLQEMKVCRRDEYLKVLHEREILPSEKFIKLVWFLRGKAKKFRRQKLRLLMRELEKLMDISPCIPIIPEPVVKPVIKTQINVDTLKIHNALSMLMRPGIPNIVHVTDLKNFLTDLMLLTADHAKQLLERLKHLEVISLPQFKFIEDYINLGKLGKVDPEQKKQLLKIIQKAGSTPPASGIFTALDIPPGKGPRPPPKPEIITKSKDLKSKDLTPQEKPKPEEQANTEEDSKKDDKKEADKKDAKKGAGKKNAKKGAGKKSAKKASKKKKK